MWSYAVRRVPDPDDVVSEVFAAAWRHRDRLPEPPRPWLLRAAHHHVQHATRALARQRRLSDRIGRGGETFDHADRVASWVDAAAVVAAVLPRLSVGDQELLRMYFWDDLPVTEMAYVLSSTQTAVKVRLHRARRRLAALVEARTRAATRGHDAIEALP